MKPGKTLWEELDAARVGDAVIGEAYEAAGARSRSLLKTYIAQAHAAFGHILPFSKEESIVSYPGTAIRRLSRPVDWCLVLLPRSYAPSHALPLLDGAGPGNGAEKRGDCAITGETAAMRAARQVMLAALCALFAGVSDVWALIVENGDDAEAKTHARRVDNLIYAGLELAGVENVCLLSERRLLRLFSHLAAEGPGRILVMGEPHWRDRVLQCFCARKGVLVWCEGGASASRAAQEGADAVLSQDGEKGEHGEEESAPWRVLWPVLPASFFREERIECRGWTE